MSQRSPAEASIQAVLAAPPAPPVGLDFDGTLAPIVEDPEHAFADPASVAALARIGPLLGTVAVITGRPVRTAVRLGGVRGLAGVRRGAGGGSPTAGAAGGPGTPPPTSSSSPPPRGRSPRWRRRSRRCSPSWG